jgi:hypothetical protein
LVAVTLLPLILLGLALSVDLANYYGDTRAVQTALDDAAMHGYRYLPYSDDAERAVRSYLGMRYPEYFSSGEGLSAQVSSDAIALRYDGRSPVYFPRLFGWLTQSEVPEDVGIAATSVVRATAMDVLVALDMSARYLAPPLEGPAWGDIASWPAAEFFQNQHTFIRPSGEAVEARVATQQCWNPALDSLKRAALKTYQYFTSFNRDQVGVALFPGYGAHVDVIREVRALDVVTEGEGEARWIGFYGEARGDAYCSAAAERELQTPQYQVPAPVPGLRSWQPPAGGPSELITPPNWTFDPANAPFLGTARTVWGAVARDGPVTEFPMLTQYVASLLLGAPVMEERRALKMKSMKLGFLFLGDLPWAQGIRWVPGASNEGALRQALQNLRVLVSDTLEELDMRLHLYLVLFDHIGNGGVSLYVDELQALLDQELGAGEEASVSAEVLFAQSAERFASEMLPALLLSRRNVVVAQ